MAATSPFDLAEAKRRWEGFETPLTGGRYPVESDAIRRHCHMVDDVNPRFLDEGWCPPALVDYFAGEGAWPGGEIDLLRLVRRVPAPGDRFLNLNQDLEWLRAVRVGERLGARHRIVAVEERPTRLDPASVWITTETTVVDQTGAPVMRMRNQIMVHRSPGTE